MPYTLSVCAAFPCVSNRSNCIQALAQPGQESWLHSNSSSGDGGGQADMVFSGMAAFLLASLAATGLAAPLVPRNDSFAVHALERAVLASNDLAARLALADRLLEGRGTPLNCTAGFQ